MFKHLLVWGASLALILGSEPTWAQELPQPQPFFKLAQSKAQVQSIPFPTDEQIALVMANNSPTQLEIYRYYSQSTASADGDLTLASQGTGKWLKISKSTASGSGGGGGLGDFVGPSSSTNHNLAMFGDGTGKLGADSGIATDGVGGLIANSLAISGTGTPSIIMTNGAYTARIAANGSQSASINLILPADGFSGSLKTTKSGTNWTIAQGIGFTDYKDFIFPGRVDGTGCTITTNDYTSGLWGLATHAGTGGTNANYAVYKIGTVPLDLDTSTTMVLKNLAFRVSGSDTGSASFSVAYFSPSSSSAASPTDYTACTGFVTFTSGSLTSPATGDAFYMADVTLTGWASGLTAGRPFIIAIARDGGDANNDSISILGGTISYGRTQ